MLVTFGQNQTHADEPGQGIPGLVGLLKVILPDDRHVANGLGRDQVDALAVEEPKVANGASVGDRGHPVAVHGARVAEEDLGEVAIEEGGALSSRVSTYEESKPDRADVQALWACPGSG